jgi:lipopolysaccharide export system protein LptA
MKTAGHDRAERHKGAGWIAAAMLVCLAGAGPLFWASAPAAAQQLNTGDLQKANSSKRNVNIEADRMEVLDEQKQAIFTGNVDAKREDVTLHSDKLVVDYADTIQQDNTKKTEVRHLEATGNVVIITSKQRITGQWAKVDVKANKLTVGDDVTVVQDRTVLKGKQLFVDLKTNRSELSGGRVKGSFVPSPQ